MHSRKTHAKRGTNQILGYSLVYRNDRSVNNGGILIRVRDNIKNISLDRRTKAKENNNKKRI